MSPKKRKAPEAAGRKRPRALSPEEAALWAAVAAGARPLSPDRRVRAGPAPAADPADPAAGARADKPPDRLSPPPRLPARPRPPAPELTPGAAPGVDKRLAERLRRGELPVEAALDLHGMRQDEAQAALAAFVLASRRAERRCVLVITGKGSGGAGDGERGVLRAAVPRWLNAAPLRPHVLAFAWARPRHGGAGALYVLLRRTRTRRAVSGADPAAG